MIIILWFLLNKVDNFSRNKTGLLVALYCECDQSKKRIENDLIKNLKESFKCNEEIQIKLLSDYYCNKIIENEVFLNKIIKKNNGRIFLVGSCKIRKVKGVDHYYLNFIAKSNFSDLPEDITALLSKRMNNNKTIKKLVNANNELEEFELFSSELNYFFRNILSIAALFSGNFNTAKTLAIHALKELKNKNQFLQIYNDLCITYTAAVHDEIYIDYKNTNEITEEQFTHLKSALEYRELPSIRLMTSIHYFTNGRRSELALKELNMIKRRNFKPHMYSTAFLLAYNDKLQESYKYYMKIFNNHEVNDTDYEVEEFINRQVELETNKKYVMFYILGILYFHRFNNTVLANECITSFLELCPNESQYFIQIKAFKKMKAILA